MIYLLRIKKHFFFDEKMYLFSKCYLKLTKIYLLMTDNLSIGNQNVLF